MLDFFHSLKELKKNSQTVFHFYVHQLRDIFSFRYNDTPMEDKYYELHRYWLNLLHEYYFKVDHIGYLKTIQKVAKCEKLIVISNHANTLEAMLICYYFYWKNLGRLRPLVYKGVFRLPLVRELFRSGQSLPVSVEAGTQALRKNHILIFPEGMDFIKHYVKRDYVVKYHKGFLRIARAHLKETGKKHMSIVPVANDGIEDTIKFWILNQEFLVKHFIEPYLKYPYFVVPKLPIIFPTKAVFNWGRPRRVTLEELEDESHLAHVANEFRHEILKLKNRARKVRELSIAHP